MVRRSHLSVSPLGLALIFLTGCMAGAGIQALSGGSLPPIAAVALEEPPPPIAAPVTMAAAQPLTRKAVKTFAVRGQP